MKMKKETILLHAGHHLDSSMSRAVPIYQTTSFVFNNSQHAADLFALEENGNIYTRLGNPTIAVFEERMAEFEGGVAALAVASGQAAVTIAMLGLASAGDEIVSAVNIYGGTYSLFHYTFARMGIKVNFVDSNDLEGFKKAITPKTKAIFAESIGNPQLQVLDIEKLAAIAHEAKIPLVVDNTVAPYLLSPFEHGADIIIYSATKFIGGHGNSIAGLIVDSGNFNWDKERYPQVAADDPSYHGLNFVSKFGKGAYIARLRLNLLRDMGPALSPFNAFLLIQGLETLHLRMPRHLENAMKVALFLSNHPKVAWVNFPGLASSREHDKAVKYLGGNGGALIGFGVKGGYESAVKLIDNLQLISHLANIGDARTLIIHPASTTHQQLTSEERQRGGVGDDFIRLSVGIENVEDIIADFEQSLEKI